MKLNLILTLKYILQNVNHIYNPLIFILNHLKKKLIYSVPMSVTIFPVLKLAISSDISLIS